MSSTTEYKQYKQVSDFGYSLPGWRHFEEGEKCEIVFINGDLSKLVTLDGGGGKTKTFSPGPFIEAILQSRGDSTSTYHGGTPRAIVKMMNGEEIIQEDINKRASFYFVIKGGEEIRYHIQSQGGRKSRSRKSNKNKRTRRKSMKRLHRRK
jgi:hypothetical protein